MYPYTTFLVSYLIQFLFRLYVFWPLLLKETICTTNVEQLDFKKSLIKFRSFKEKK